MTWLICFKTVEETIGARLCKSATISGMGFSWASCCFGRLQLYPKSPTFLSPFGDGIVIRRQFLLPTFPRLHEPVSHCVPPVDDRRANIVYPPERIAHRFQFLVERASLHGLQPLQAIL